MIELIKRFWPYFLAGVLFGGGIVWFINWITNWFFNNIKSIEMRIEENGNKD